MRRLPGRELPLWLPGRCDPAGRSGCAPRMRLWPALQLRRRRTGLPLRRLAVL